MAKISETKIETGYVSSTWTNAGREPVSAETAVNSSEIHRVLGDVRKGVAVQSTSNRVSAAAFCWHPSLGR